MKKNKMIRLIDMLFESKYAVSSPQIDQDETDGSIIAVNYYFNTDENQYRVTFNSFEEPRVFEVELGVNSGEMRGLNTDQMTGEGKALKILNTVADIINSFLKTFSKDYDKVVISGTNEKRKQVYRKFFPKKINPEYLEKVVIR